MLRWYLIHTKPCSEAPAQSHLLRQGYDAFLPRIGQSVLRGGSWRARMTPLFPRYLFLRLQEGVQSLGPVRSTTGVASVVRFGARYAIVPDAVIDDLKGRADPSTGLLRLLDPAQLRQGAPVRIGSGPFGGLEGVFHHASGSARVVVLLELLGQDARVHVPVEAVLPRRAA